MRYGQNRLSLLMSARRSTAWIYAGLLSALLLLLPSSAFSGPGRTTANFLEVDAGGKPTAMGGTQFGSESESFAQFYNPALLSGISQKEMGVMHNQAFNPAFERACDMVAAGISWTLSSELAGYDSIIVWKCFSAVLKSP